MIVIIVRSIVDSHNLPGVVGHVLLSVWDNVADGNVPVCASDFIDGVVVAISVVESVEDGFQYISIIVINECQFDVVVVFGGDNDRFHVEVGVVFV